jgi:hypothetical protein
MADKSAKRIIFTIRQPLLYGGAVFGYTLFGGYHMVVSFLIRSATSPLNPLSTKERGLQNTLKCGFLPLLQSGEGGWGGEVKETSTLPLLTNWHLIYPNTHNDLSP